MLTQGRRQAFARDLTMEARELLRAVPCLAGEEAGSESRFRLSTSGDGIDLHFPSRLADDATVAALMAKVGEIAERHEVVMEVRRKDGSGLDFVLEGRLAEAPSPGP